MSDYQSKPVAPDGTIDWSPQEHETWHDLVERQQKVLGNRACQAYLDGLAMLDLPSKRIPKLSDINHVIQRETGWRLAPVPALISFDRFFELLAQKQFPVATFLRRREEFDYLQEPDFFHEVFGHCAMLTHPDFAKFTQVYGQLGRQVDHQTRVFLARLYWFTVEFGLVREHGKLRIYGGGILSSPGETCYALESNQPQRIPFDIHTVLRTPYRIDIMQPIYFVLNDISALFRLSHRDLLHDVQQAMAAGLLPPLFEPKEVNNA